MGDQKRIVTYSNRKERYAALAQEFVTHPKKTLVVSPDNRSREALNIAIRVAMREAGLLSIAGYDMPVLVARDVTGMDRTRSVSYQPGDVVRYIQGSAELATDRKLQERQRKGSMNEELTPEQFIEQVSDVLPVSSATEKRRLVQHARAWADVSYPDGLPDSIEVRLKFLEARGMPCFATPDQVVVRHLSVLIGQDRCPVYPEGRN